MTEPRSGELFHFTCGHAAPRIASDGVLKPNLHPLLGISVVWLTDLSAPMRLPLGLTSYALSCDRTEYRFDVEPARMAEHWPRFCRRVGMGRDLRDEVESAPGAMPAHWWVSTEPVAVMHRTPIRMAVVA